MHFVALVIVSTGDHRDTMGHPGSKGTGGWMLCVRVNDNRGRCVRGWAVSERSAPPVTWLHQIYVDISIIKLSHMYYMINLLFTVKASLQPRFILANIVQDWTPQKL